MAQQSVLSDVLGKRRDRVIAILLSFKERECDQHLPRDVQVRFRKIVLDQLNEFADLCTDIMRSLDAGDSFNELYLERLEAKVDTLLDRTDT